MLMTFVEFLVLCYYYQTLNLKDWERLDDYILSCRVGTDIDAANVRWYATAAG